MLFVSINFSTKSIMFAPMLQENHEHFTVRQQQ